MNKKICIYIIMIPIVILFACSHSYKINKEQHSQNTQNKVQFEIKTDSIWRVPSQRKNTNLNLSLEITNLEDYPLKFLLKDKLMISMKPKNRDELIMNGGQDILLANRKETVIVQSRKKYLVSIFAELTIIDHQIQLKLEDDFGSIWWIGPLQPGVHYLNIVYENKAGNPYDNLLVWTGKANIKPFLVQIN